MQNSKGTRLDLGVSVSDNLSARAQVESAATTANSILGRLKRVWKEAEA
jgi:hypothetical protein